MFFEIQNTDKYSDARTGIIKTDHGKFETPVFMPVGTAGSVKGVLHDTLINDIKASIILGNTYHLYLRPGIEIIEAAGGLHKFINWNLPILTDSGGYQVFSLAEKRKIIEQGAEFRSHIDGSVHLFTPEKVVEIQRTLGSDIMMAFDECTPYPCDKNYAKKSLELTNKWLKRGYSHFTNTSPLYNHNQYFFPIIQGSTYEDLRKQSAEEVLSYNFVGYAIGGLSVGEPDDIMYRMISVINDLLPEEKPRYLMGVGTPSNILEAIALGIDMFDCVMPTRNGRNGMLFTRNGIINIRNEKWKNDFSLIDEESDCFVDKKYSKAYLRHLFVADEMLGPIIASIHNLAFYMWLVETARNKIEEGVFSQWKNNILFDISKRL